MKEQLYKVGVNAQSSMPQALGKRLEADVAKWAKVIKAAKIPIE